MSSPRSLPIIKASGTHYEVGYQIGIKTKELIHSALKKELFDKAVSKINADSEYKQLYDGYLSVVAEEYPQYVEEMQGIADGSGTSFQKIFICSLYEFQLLLVEKSASLRCTDVFVNTEKATCFGHNEDAVEEDVNICYILDADIVNDRPRGRLLVDRERFVCFCYPAMNVLLRACLSATSPIHLREIIINHGYGVASPVSLNVAFLSDKQTLCHYDIYTSRNSDEHGRKTEYEYLEIRKQKETAGEQYGEKYTYGYFFHGNEFRSVKNVCDIHPNSAKRTQFLASLCTSAVTTKANVKELLGHDRIYQTMESKDKIGVMVTIATAVFDLDKEELEIYDNTRPHANIEPNIVFKLDACGSIKPLK
ncbi:beta-alanyl-dopamine/carcinine hydrolase-like [Tubulanus polymorphus]|uniref:beta-alanyl-dopamine/carcinine hydrolase-like n=1 Tax=Tubulanus polymorphus TaxID=672921 RepID=UPI003DA586CA